MANATVSIGSKPELSAKAYGIYSKASAKALIAYYSTELMLSAYSLIYEAIANSTAPPPYTILLSLINVLTTQTASCKDLSASSNII